MELKAHVQILVDLDPFYISNKTGESLTRLLEIGITESKLFKQHEFLVDLLNVACVLVFTFHRRKALFPLRALVSHVLAECPQSKDSFTHALTMSCPELKNALL